MLESAPRRRDRRERMMSARSDNIQPPSPLDDFLARFLRCLGRLPDGFSPIADGQRVANECGLVPEFVEALFVSARTRGLIEPFRARGAKGRYRWKVSGRGDRWLATREI
jgi:hypothetical protein